MNSKFLILVAAALVLSACGGSTSGSAPTAAPAAPAASDAFESGIAANGAGGTAAEPAVSDAQGFNRLVIKTADMSIQVEDVRATEAAIRLRATALGGYIVESQSRGSDDNLRIQITFRVPVNRFDDALSGLQGMAKKVLSNSVGGQDVTEEFVDLEARRKTLEATRDRLLDLLTKATTVEDTLKINESLNEYQTQIDQIAGRAKFLSQSAAMSTVNVSVAPVPLPSPIISEDGWQPLAVARDSLRALVGFGQRLASLAIVLLVWSPVWLVFGFGAWLMLRKVRAGNKAKPNAAP